MQEKRSQTAVVGVSLDLETLNYLQDYVTEHKMSRSRAIAYHIRMARVYLKMIEEQIPSTGMMNVNGAKDGNK